MRTPHLTFLAAGAVSAAVGLVALPALSAGATVPPPDPDAVRDAAASALVSWAAGEGIALADPACTKPAAPEAGQALTCYATDDAGTTVAYLTSVPADGVWVFAERPAAPMPGVQPPEGYPGDTATSETIAVSDGSAPAGEFTQAEVNASLIAPTPDIGPAGNHRPGRFARHLRPQLPELRRPHRRLRHPVADWQRSGPLKGPPSVFSRDQNDFRFRFCHLAALRGSMATKSDALGRAMRVAATQHGAVSTRQLRSVGVTARDQRDAVASGLFQLATPTVTVVAGSEDTWYRRLRVGLLHLGDDACVSHEAAAGLLGLDRTIPEALEFTVLRARRSATVPGATVHTTPKYGRADVITVEGFRCTSATRTVIDLAASGAAENRLGAAIDSSVRFRLSAPLVLEERLGQVRGRGKRGVRLFDQLLIDTGGETMLERKFLKLVREAGLPRPITQQRIKRDADHVARVDFLYAGQRMVIEVSGRLGHTTPAERDKDAQRRNELQDLGYAVYEYTWAHVTRRPGYVVTTLRERLLLRSA